jgi:hypothetical protein
LLWRHTEFAPESTRQSLGPHTQLAGPRESDHGLAGILFGKSREEVRVSDPEMTFDPIIHPGSTLTRPPKPASTKAPAKTTLA